MKILHLLSQRPDSTGSGIYLRAMIEHAASKGYQNGLVAGIQYQDQPVIAQIPRECCSYATFGETGDIKHLIVGMSDIMPYESRTFGSLTEEEVDYYLSVFKEKLCYQIENFSPDIIHSHHLWLLSSLAKEVSPALPMVTTCHGTDLRQFINNPHLQDRVLQGCRKIDKILALSGIQKRQIAELYTIPYERIDVVGAGFNTRLFGDHAKESTETVHILYAGKLSSFKGVPHLLRSLSKLEDQSFHLHLVGSSTGEQLQNCLALAKKLGEKVTVYGAIAQAELAALMQKCHLFVLPSFFEGLPLVILEALASGCMVITNEMPGTTEIVSKTGTERVEILPMPELATIDTPHPESVAGYEAALSAALKRTIQAINNMPVFEASGNRGNIDYFSWQQVFKRTADNYQSVLKK